MTKQKPGGHEDPVLLTSVVYYCSFVQVWSMSTYFLRADMAIFMKSGLTLPLAIVAICY